MIPSADRGTVITKPLQRPQRQEGHCTTPPAMGTTVDVDGNDDDDDNDNGGDDDTAMPGIRRSRERIILHHRRRTDSTSRGHPERRRRPRKGILRQQSNPGIKRTSAVVHRSVWKCAVRRYLTIRTAAGLSVPFRVCR
ncbi:hypothetical protein PUN28_011088 [Cardiocondyla obscurior]|uniref:Uncharacterized protein n=1 Tax=Cardiocondyla obscurior TaxID=286306 RepID=A0AAW2FKL9_9HYME